MKHFFKPLLTTLSVLLMLLPCAFVAAQTSYTMGVGDEIRLTVYNQPDLTIEGQISADGTLALPLIGSVQLAGRTTADAARMIAEYFVRGEYLQDAHVNILVTKYRSQSVSILGKVNRPGQIILEGPLSLTEAIATAGGVAESGSERLVLVRTDAKGSQQREEYDLQKLLNHDADNSQIIWLKDGDTIYVPVAGRFYLSGEVRSPGMYALDRPLNVMQALGVGGGMTTRASERSLKLFRRQANGSVQELRTKPDDPVLDGDVLVVQESLF